MLSKQQVSDETGVSLSVPVSNTGKRAGTEVVQVYIKREGDTDGAIRTLRGFRRVMLNAGESRDAVIRLPRSSFEFFDRMNGKMSALPGIYDVWYGNSSDIKDLQQVKVQIL